MKRRQRGNILITLIVVVVILAGAYFSWHLYQQLVSEDASSAITIPFSQKTTAPSDQTKGWKLMTMSSLNVSLYYPPDWLTAKDNYIAEYTYSPQSVLDQNIYNLIQVDKVSNQLEPSYPNDSLFNDLYGLKRGDSFKNDYFPNRTPIKKISSGRIKSGQQYVIIQYDGDSNIEALILNGIVLYDITLLYSDQQGQQLFEPIVRTFQLS